MNKTPLLIFSIIAGIIAVILVTTFSLKTRDIPLVNYNTGSISRELDVMSFNIQIFGRSKSSKPEVMDIIIDIIDDYDLIAIQEIRDSSDQTLNTLMSMMPHNYKLVAGPREGRSSSKEQAIFVYDDDKLDFLESYNYPDINDVYERSPFLAIFETDDGGLIFQIINVHLTPDDVDSELYYLSRDLDVYDYSLILVGDFNADGSYFDEEELINYFPNDKYNIIISNDYNTTVSSKDNTYDRIITSNDLNVNFYDVLYFDKLLNGLEAKSVSDHYPVHMTITY